MMAEVAAGAVAVEQVLATTLEAGAASYAVGKPSNGLKATFTQLATAPADGTRSSLPRSNHSLTVLGGRAYIFGGQTEADKLANSDMHSFTLPGAENKSQPEYHLTPAIALADCGQVPEPRMDHSACALIDRIAVYGGLDEAGRVLEDPVIWLYDPQKPAWDAVQPKPSTAAPCSRSAAKIFTHGDNLLLYGGKDSAGSSLADVWLFDFSIRTWARLPDAPVSTTNATLAETCLYLISANDALSSTLHHLELLAQNEESPSWDAVQFPTNPLAPGPRPRENAGLLNITTGFGRNYLIYFFGDHKAPQNNTSRSPPQWSDMWSLQLPASTAGIQRRHTISEAVTPAKIKDAIRSKLGVYTGTFTWAEVDVKPLGDLSEPEGKIHPGPRSSFGCDVLTRGNGVAIWGGTNAKGEREGDGWVIQLE